MPDAKKNIYAPTLLLLLFYTPSGHVVQVASACINGQAQIRVKAYSLFSEMSHCIYCNSTVKTHCYVIPFISGVQQLCIRQC